MALLGAPSPQGAREDGPRARGACPHRTLPPTRERQPPVGLRGAPRSPGRKRLPPPHFLSAELRASGTFGPGLVGRTVATISSASVAACRPATDRIRQVAATHKA